MPFITPSKKQIKIENKRSLSNKLGIELDQGIFLSAILSDPLQMETTYVKQCLDHLN